MDTNEPKMRLVVGKKELLADVRHLQGLLIQYCDFLGNIGPGADWAPSAQQMLRNHAQFLEQARISLQSLDLASALIRHIFAMRPGDALAIPTKPPETHIDSNESDSTAGLGIEEIRHLIAQVNSLSRHAPIAFQERLRFLLNSLLRFLESLPEHNLERTEEILAEINLLTSDRESRYLVRDVARLARDVYNSVKAVSDGLPIETLEETSEGASEAVRKLRSVILRLERAATQNLDELEKVNALQSEDIQTLSAVRVAAKKIQGDLAKLKHSNPEASEALDMILERMGNDVSGTIMHLTSAYDRQAGRIMQQVSNQSFQDLTGATLKKIIAFVESVQLQLLAVLERYRSVLTLVQSDMGLRPGEQPAPIRTKTEASQDQVDQLLAQYGF